MATQTPQNGENKELEQYVYMQCEDYELEGEKPNSQNGMVKDVVLRMLRSIHVASISFYPTNFFIIATFLKEQC